MKWAIAIGGAYGAWTLYEANKALAPVSLILVVVAGIHLFAKMRRADWVLFNWVGIAAFGLMFGALYFCQRLSTRNCLKDNE